MNAAIVRTVLLALALLNQILSACGYQVLPITDETVAELVNAGFTVVTAVMAWWKDNSLKRGEKQ